MGNLDFSADEIFEMAQQIERNGARFYRRAASVAKAAGNSSSPPEAGGDGRRPRENIRPHAEELTPAER